MRLTIGSWAMRRFVEKNENRQNLTRWPLVTWPLTWPINEQSVFQYFLRSFECRLPRVATWPRSRARRGRGGVFTPHPSTTWKLRSPARRGSNMFSENVTSAVKNTRLGEYFAVFPSLSGYEGHVNSNMGQWDIPYRLLIHVKPYMQYALTQTPLTCDIIIN